jgi:hypothetical protein
MFFVCEPGKLSDEAYYLAQRAERAGTVLQFSQYDALLHNLACFFLKSPQSKHLLRQIVLLCHDSIKNQASVERKCVRYAADDAEFCGQGSDPSCKTR